MWCFAARPRSSAGQTFDSRYHYKYGRSLLIRRKAGPHTLRSKCAKADVSAVLYITTRLAPMLSIRLASADPSALPVMTLTATQFNCVIIIFSLSISSNFLVLIHLWTGNSSPEASHTAWRRRNPNTFRFIGSTACAATFGGETFFFVKIIISSHQRYWRLLFPMANIVLATAKEVRHIYIQDAQG